MNKKDEALLVEAARVLGPGPKYQPPDMLSVVSVMDKLMDRLRELAPDEEPLADGYYWVIDDGKSPVQFILERKGSFWWSCGSEDNYVEPLPFRVLGPVAPWAESS